MTSRSTGLWARLDSELCVRLAKEIYFFWFDEIAFYRYIFLIMGCYDKQDIGGMRCK